MSNLPSTYHFMKIVHDYVDELEKARKLKKRAAQKLRGELINLGLYETHKLFPTPEQLHAVFELVLDEHSQDGFDFERALRAKQAEARLDRITRA